MSGSTCCPECGDSPLSITGNITGILTFASAILASSLLFLVVVRSAENEMLQLRASVEQAARHLDAIVGYFHGLDFVADPDLAFIKEPISSAMRDWHTTSEDLIEQLKELENMQPAIGRRLAWWYRHNDILAAMTKLRSEKDDLFALFLTYLLRHVPNSPSTSGANSASLQQAEYPVESSLETRKDCTERDEPRYGIVRNELPPWGRGEPAVDGPSFTFLSAGSKHRDSGNKEEGNGKEGPGEGDMDRLAEGLELENRVIVQQTGEDATLEV